MLNGECSMLNGLRSVVASIQHLTFNIEHSTLKIQHLLSHAPPPSDGAPAGAPSNALLISSFNSFPGLKYGIFFDGTSTFSPVFGLRPVRDLRLRRRKLPKPRSSIF